MSGLLLVLGGVLQIDGEELLIEMVIFDLAIDDSLVVRDLLGATRRTHILKHEEYVTFDIGPQSLVRNNGFILILPH